METKKLILSAMLCSLSLICYSQVSPDTLLSKHDKFLKEAKQAGAYNPEPKQQKEANAIPTTPEEKRKALLTPEYYTKFLGASFFTIATIEKEFDVVPIQIVGLTFFYDFGDCFVGMEAVENGVVVQMTIRLFADMATDFIHKAVDYGYKYVAKGKDVNVRSNTGKLLPDVYDTSVKRYCKTTNSGNVYLEVSTNDKNANEYEIAIFRTKL